MAYTKDEVQNLTKEAIALGLTTDKLLENIGSNFTKLFDAVDFLAENSEEAGVAGSQLEVSVDSKTYVMTIKLKNTAGTVLSEKTIDLPIETMVVDASYANGKLTLKLQNGTTLSDIDISSLISGLVPETRKINGKDLSNDITLTQDNVGEGTTYTRFSKTDKSNLDKNTTARHTHDNKSVLDATTASFTTEEKAKLAGIESNAQNYVLPTANGTRLGGVKTGGDVEVNDGVVTVLTVGGQSADQIGKVKDVTVNGASVLGDNGTAALLISDLSSSFKDVTASASKAINGTTYYGFNIANATEDVSLEVYNSSGQQIVVQKVRDTTTNTIFVACSTTSGGTYSVRSIGGNGIGSDGDTFTIAPIVRAWHTSIDEGGYEYTLDITNPNPFPLTVYVDCTDEFDAGGNIKGRYTIDANVTKELLAATNVSTVDNSAIKVYYERCYSGVVKTSW